MRFVVFGVAVAAMCVPLVNCCEQEFCSSGDSNNPDLVYTSSASGCEECGGRGGSSGVGGFGGVESPFVSGVSSSVSGTSITTTTGGATNPWGSSCWWCNGPGCEDFDEACIEIEPDSRSLLCRDIDSEPVSDKPNSLCFTARDRQNLRVLCCFDPTDVSRKAL